MVERKEALDQFRTPSANGQKIEQNEIEVVHLEGGIDIYLQRNIVIQNGSLVDSLSFTEREILNYLAANVAKVVPNQQIIDNLCIAESSLRTHVQRIRAKLNFDKKDDGPLKTVLGFGYMLDDERENPSSLVKAAGGVEVDFDRKQVKKDDTLVQMPAQEYQLIELLVANMGRAIFKREIFKHVWGDDLSHGGDLKVLLRRVRQNLGFSKEGPLRTIYGIGVILLTPEMEEAEKAKVHNQEVFLE